MSRKRWQDPDDHPPAPVLLLHVEDELDARDSLPVRAHLDACLDCRTSCERMQRGMASFNEFHGSVLLPTPPSHLTELEGRMQEATKGKARIGFMAEFQVLQSSWKLRTVYATSAAACILIGVLAYFFTYPRQSVYASQILNDARIASNSLLVKSKVLNQKFRLRQGTLTFERTAQHGRAVPAGKQDPPVGAQLQKSLDLAHIQLNDPLSVNDFTDWRSAQRDHFDSVRETSQNFIITVKVEGSSITKGSLTLSRSSLRPVSRSVEFREGEPIQIDEESYSIDDVIPSIAESPRTSLEPHKSEVGEAASEAVEPSEGDLEKAELDLREALHALGADVSAAPQVWRADHAVLYYARPRALGLRESIEAAAAHIPYVKEADRGRAAVGVGEPPEPNGPYVTTPPLSSELLRFAGSQEAASAFLDAAGKRSSKVQAEAEALEELGKRYPPDVVKGMPSDLRKRVNGLASSLLTSLQRDTADYDKFLAPMLQSASQGLTLPASTDSADKPTSCLTWQQSAALAAPRLRQLGDDVKLMFEPRRTESPNSPSAEELLADTVHIQSFLNSHLVSTCELF